MYKLFVNEPFLPPAYFFLLPLVFKEHLLMVLAFLHKALAADALLLSLAVKLQGPAMPRTLSHLNSSSLVWFTGWCFGRFEGLYQRVQLYALAELWSLWEDLSAFRAFRALLNCGVPVAFDALLTEAVSAGQSDRDGKHLQTNAAI